MIDAHDGYTPTPVISHAILTYNNGRTNGLADGVVITPSHNPPEDGGFKYNPPNGGPADTDVTRRIEHAANGYLEDGLEGVKRIPYDRARKSSCVHRYDYIAPYVADLAQCRRHGGDPRRRRQDRDRSARRRGGALLAADHRALWPRRDRRQRRGRSDLPLHDAWIGTARSGWIAPRPIAMARLIGMRDKFDVAFANDTDADRHGIVTRSSGLMNPNHYLAVAIAYLFAHRPQWRADSAVGKTIVSSAHHRSRRDEARPQAGGSAGRLQMVRRRPARRLVRLRRRGKRRRLVPAARRLGVDHRQGRPHSRDCSPPR